MTLLIIDKRGETNVLLTYTHTCMGRAASEHLHACNHINICSLVGDFSHVFFFDWSFILFPPGGGGEVCWSLPYLFLIMLDTGYFILFTLDEYWTDIFSPIWIVTVDGGGGKGTWGKLLDTDGESHVDRNDPNYDSGEVIVISSFFYLCLLIIR